MTGSLQVKKDVYYTVIYVKDRNGKASQKWKTTGLHVKGNKRNAEKILRDRIAECEKQCAIEYKDILFTDFMTEWLEVIQTQVKANTYHQYSLIVKNSIVPFFQEEKVKLQDLQPHHIQKYYASLLKRGASGNTVKHHHANILKALNYALKSNWVLYNPASRVDLPKLESFTGKFYSGSQIQTLFLLVEGRNIETPVLLTATYGLRRSETLGLKWGAIDLKHGTITIRHTVVGNGAHMICSDTTKTSTSTRTLPLLPHIKDHLQQVRARQKEMKLLLGSAYSDSDYICTWDDGRLIRPEYLSRTFKALLKDSDLPVIRYHDLRHSSASLLIANGFNLKQIQEWLGHSSITTTNRYAHLQHDSTVTMADKIGELLFPKNSLENSLERSAEKEKAVS
jgi:integrase